MKRSCDCVTCLANILAICIGRLGHMIRQVLCCDLGEGHNFQHSLTCVVDYFHSQCTLFILHEKEKEFHANS